jgi:hypothetical protein
MIIPKGVSPELWKFFSEEVKTAIIAAENKKKETIRDRRERYIHRLIGEERYVLMYNLWEIELTEQEANNLLDELHNEFQLAKFGRPTIKFPDKDLKTAWADASYRKNEIRLFSIGQQVHTLLHEYAHFVNREKCGFYCKPHGKEFKYWHWKVFSWYVKKHDITKTRREF